MSASCCSVPLATLVYALPGTLEEFERLALPENKIGSWKADATKSLIEDDGKPWEARCRSKTLGELASDSPAVIFQWWEYRHAPATDGGEA